MNKAQRRYLCIKCNHKQHTNIWGEMEKCNCDGCETLRLQKQKEKKQLIEEVYTGEADKISFEDMALSDQVILINLLLSNPLRNTSQVEPFKDSHKMIHILNRLLDIHAISVSSESNIDAFYAENFPHRYDVTLVKYNVNVSFIDETVRQINKRKYFIDNSDPEELIFLYKHYIYIDIIQKFSEMLKDRRLSLKITKDADNKLRELINILSYSKILGLCLRVAKFLSDKVVVGDMPSYVASNAALGNVSKFYERAIDFGWNLMEAEFEEAGDELAFFIEVIMGKDLSILQDVATVDNLLEWPDKERDYSSRVREE